MRCEIALNTMSDVERFSSIVKTVDSDVRLTGKDENGNPWELSAKSFLSSLILTAGVQKKRKHTAHDVDWNTLKVECKEDIYSLIKEFVVE